MRHFRAALRAALLGAAALCAVLPTPANAQGSLLPLPDDKPIRGLNFPALSPDGKTLCFEYIGDLWTVPAGGGSANRLTIHEAHDGYPHYSPDGRWIAFSSNREGNYDVYLISSQGGSAKQLTFNSANDYVMDWSPDGSKVLFYSMRQASTWQLYSLDIKTNTVKTLTTDDWQIRYGVYSPDGGSVAYNRCGNIGTWWRPRYHGSANMDVYTKNLSSGKITRVTDYDGGDMWPMYSGDGKRIYYASDRLTPNVPNIVYSASTGGKPTLITKHKSDAVRWPSISHDGSRIAYLYGGDIWTVNPTSKGTDAEAKKVEIYAPTDDKINNISRLTMTNGATEVEVSPDGKTLALVLRGELWTMPATGGDAKRLTNSPSNDYDIIWSKDGSRLVFASDRNGSFDIFTIDVKTKDLKTLSSDSNDETNPKYSPDGKWVSFLRSGTQGGIYVVPADGSAAPRRVVESLGNNLEFGVGITSYSWSPDNRYIAFARRDAINASDIWIVPVAGGKARNVTYYPGSGNIPANTDPDWTADGKYLLFVSFREAQPDVYKIPLVPEKEEPDAPAPAPTPPPGSPGVAPTTPMTPTEKKAVEVKIDFDDIDNRVKRLTTQGVANFEPTPDGKAIIFISATGGTPDYYVMGVAGGSAQRMTMTGEGIGLPRFYNETGRFFAIGAGGTAKVVQRTGPIWQAQPIAFTARMDFDRRAEIRQAFNEFWRRINVGFYDAKMHGVDWAAIRKQYEPLLQGVGTKEDFAMYLLSPMVGELNSSHSEPSPAAGAAGSQTAELGITFDESYVGPGLKVTGYMPEGPDDDLGPRIKPGEYILTIDGEDVTWNESAWLTLADKAGKTVELLVNSKPSKDGARTVKLKPVAATAWRDLEYERKIKATRAQVDKLSGGRLAYLHIRAMDQPSLRRMERELWGKARDKDALVLDIRGNNGGNTHDAILGQISRPVYGYQQPRDGVKTTQPTRYWGKPIILLMDQNSVSDGEIFPLGFRNLHIGKIVGMPTPGYVIGTYEGHLQDGTGYRIPMWGWYGADGKNMENNGVQPDVKVEPTEEDIQQHRDRQLETAVDMLLRELPKQSKD